MQSPSTPKEPASEPPKRAVFQTETTGSYWGDVKEAVKRISLWDDLQKIGEIQCARSSLLSGIASGAGVGVIRGMSSGPLVASNWAVGTFMLISLGTWTICRKAMEDERRRMQTIIESMPKQLAKQQQEKAAAQAQSELQSSA